MYSSRKWRKMRRNPAWPFVAMMAAGKYGPQYGASGNWGNWGDWSGWDPGAGARRKRRRGRMFGSGELRLVLLKLIADVPRHGYELIKAIEELTADSYSPSPGTIYPTLSLLEDEGVIAPVDSDEARKAFAATDAGRAELEDRADEVEAIMDRLTDHGERRKPFASPELFRAAGNLAGVLKNRVKAGKMDEQTVEEIVDLIDELAKKIERL